MPYVLTCSHLSHLSPPPLSQGTDLTMLSKMNKVHSSSDIYIAPKSDHDIYFGIKHFAGPVYYDPIGTPSNYSQTSLSCGRLL